MENNFSPRINELMSLHAFMKDAKIKPETETAKSIMSIWAKGNMPYIKQHSNDIRAYFKKGSNFPETSDTLNIRKGNINDAIAELAHAWQFNVSSSKRDSLQDAAEKQFKQFGEDFIKGRSGGRYGYHENTDEYFPSATFEFNPELGWIESDSLTPTSRVHYEKYNPNKKQDVSVEFDAHSIWEKLIYDLFKTGKEKDELKNKERSK